MKNKVHNEYAFDQDISQIILGGIEEIVGEEELQELLIKNEIPFEKDKNNNTCLTRALSFKELNKLESSLVDLFGETGCRGAALRSGRSFFMGFYRLYGIQTGLNTLEYRMLPLKKRIQTGLERISGWLTDTTDINFEVNDDDQKWYWVLEKDFNQGEIEDCHLTLYDFTIGMLQGYLAWASGGKYYPVQKCEDNPSDLIIEIEKNAIG